jgi:hypothetical protein
MPCQEERAPLCRRQGPKANGIAACDPLEAAELDHSPPRRHSNRATEPRHLSANLGLQALDLATPNVGLRLGCTLADACLPSPHAGTALPFYFGAARGRGAVNPVQQAVDVGSGDARSATWLFGHRNTCLSTHPEKCKPADADELGGFRYGHSAHLEPPRAPGRSTASTDEVAGASAEDSPSRGGESLSDVASTRRSNGIRIGPAVPRRKWGSVPSAMRR